MLVRMVLAATSEMAMWGLTSHAIPELASATRLPRLVSSVRMFSRRPSRVTVECRKVGSVDVSWTIASRASAISTTSGMDCYSRV